MDDLSKSLSIQKILKELKRLVQELQNDPIDLSQLELDLMKEKLRQIYDMLTNVKVKEVKDHQIKTETTNQLESEIKTESEEEQADETISESDTNKEKETTIEFEVSAPEDKKQSPASSEPTLNLFEEPVLKSNDNDTKSVGEKIAAERPVESIGEVITSKNIISLKLAIGINEKFFFLNELFDGKMNEYNETIEGLDQKETLKDALELLDSTKIDKSWDDESEAFLQLKEFLQKKFN
jgi:hypothetical protein